MLNGKLEAESKRCAQAEQAQKDSEAALAALQDQLSHVSSSSESQSSAVRAKETEIKTLKSELEALTEEKSELQKARKDLQAQLLTLQESSEREVILRQRADKSLAKVKLELEEAKKASAEQDSAKLGNVSELEARLTAVQKERDALQAQLDAQADQNDSAIEALERKLADGSRNYQSIITDLKSEVERLAVSRTALETANANIQMEMEVLGSELSKSVDDLYAAQRQRVEAEAARKEAADRINMLTSELADAQKELASLRGADSESNVVVRTLRARLTEAETLSSNQASELVEIRSRVKSLEAALADAPASDAGSADAGDIAELHRHLQEAQNAHLELLAEADKLRSELAERAVMPNGASVEAQIEPLKREVERERKRANDAMDLVRKMTADMDALEEQMDSLNESAQVAKDRMKRELEEAQEALNAANSARVHAENSLATVRAERNTLEASSAEAVRKVSEAQKTIASLEARVSELAEAAGGSQNEETLTSVTVRGLERELQVLEGELDAAKASLRESEASLREKDDELDAMQRNLESQTERAETESRRVKTLQNEVTLAQEEAEREASRRKALERDKRSLASELDDARAAIESSREKTAHLEAKLADQERIVRELGGSLRGLEASNKQQLEAFKIERSASNLTSRLATSPVVQMRRADELERSYKASQEVAETERARANKLFAQTKELESEVESLTLARQQLEQRLNDLTSKSEREGTLKTELHKASEESKREFMQLQDRVSELMRAKTELEGKLRRKENEAVQASTELADAMTARKQLSEQIIQLREENEAVDAKLIKLNIVKRRQTQELEALRDQVSSSSQAEKLVAHVKELEAELEARGAKWDDSYEERYQAFVKERRDLHAEMESMRAKVKAVEGAVSTTEVETNVAAKEMEALRASLAKADRQLADSDGKLQAERALRVSVEAEADLARSKLNELTARTDKLRQENDAQRAQLDSLSGADVASVDRLKHQLSELTDERDNLVRQLRDALAGSTSDLTRQASRKTRDNWQQSRDERIKLQEMRSLRQDLEVTIQAKIQVEKTLQEVSLQNETLQEEIKNLTGQLESLKGEHTALLNTRRALGVGVPSVTTLPRQTSSVMEIDTRPSKPEPRRVAPLVSTPSEVGVGEGLSNTTLDAATPVEPRPHRLGAQIVSFNTPMRCDHCHTMLVGAIRQGYACDTCGCSVHEACRDALAPNCGGHRDHRDYLEGVLRVPKPKGIRAGWRKMFVAISGDQILLYSAENDKPAVTAEYVINALPDMAISTVTAQEVMHAQRKDVPHIFRLGEPGSADVQYFLCTSDAELNKWMAALQRQQKRLDPAARKQRMYEPRIVLNTKSLVIKGGVVSACYQLPSGNRYVIGTSDGIYVSKPGAAINTPSFTQVGEVKAVVQLEVLVKQKLIVALAGSSRSVRIWPTSALDGVPSWPIQLDITKGASTFAIGECFGRTMMAVGVKKRLMIFELDARHRFAKLSDSALPDQASCLRFFGERLVVGLPSLRQFRALALGNLDNLTAVEMPSRSEPRLAWISSTSHLAPAAIFGFKDELLLCYNSIGVFVDITGRQTRPLELRWASAPVAFAVRHNHLLVYSADAVQVISVASGETVQYVSVPAVTAVHERMRVMATGDVLRDLRYVAAPLEPEDKEESPFPLTSAVLSGSNLPRSISARSITSDPASRQAPAAAQPTGARPTLLTVPGLPTPYHSAAAAEKSPTSPAVPAGIKLPPPLTVPAAVAKPAGVPAQAAKPAAAPARKASSSSSSDDDSDDSDDSDDDDDDSDEEDLPPSVAAKLAAEKASKASTAAEPESSESTFSLSAESETMKFLKSW